MFAISPTDLDWFYFLRESGLSSGINFWTPTPWNISKLNQNELLFFMLKAPVRKIGGYGKFTEYRNLTIDDVWNQYGKKNGCSKKSDLVNRLSKYVGKRSSKPNQVNEIGCIILSDVIFFDDNSFVDIEKYDISFSKNIVKIKYYDQELPNFGTKDSNPPLFNLVEEENKSQKTRSSCIAREGQSEFKSKLSSAYKNKCCITGEIIPELLQAAHIQPYINKNSNHVQNGLLLRIDLHSLYDNYLMYIDEDYIVHVSPLVNSEYYQKFNGLKITLPSNSDYFPSKCALKTRTSSFRK